jgi:hypothetical protein
MRNKNKIDSLVVQFPIEALKNCPCCGGEAIMEGAFLYNLPAVVVKCTECRLQLRPISEERYLFYKGQKNVNITIHEAVNVAAGIWNKRVADEQGGVADG